MTLTKCSGFTVNIFNLFCYNIRSCVLLWSSFNHQIAQIDTHAGQKKKRWIKYIQDPKKEATTPPRQITKPGEIQETKAKRSKKKNKRDNTGNQKQETHHGETGDGDTGTDSGKVKRQADKASRQHTEDVLQRGGDNWTWVTHVRVGQTVTKVGGREWDENN